MKNFRKIIAVVLCFAMLIPMAVIPSYAEDTTVRQSDLESAFAEGENSLIVFVTGIGQSFSYLFDESYLDDNAFENGTLHDYDNYSKLIADGKYTACWNLFNNYFDEALKDKDFLKAAGRVVINLLFSIFTRKNTIKEADVDTIISTLFAYNIIDENGKTPARVVTPRYTMPVSEYPYSETRTENGAPYSEAKTRFFRSIPCAEIAEQKFGDNYEDYLYCYNYSAFSYTTDNVQGLHDFIETIISDNKVGAKDVVLVPMSMGASVVSAYLAAYPQVEDNHVRRVVSVVGAWNGSDVMYDLVTQQYVDNSADLVYNGLIAELVGLPWGYLVNFALRLFPKQGLRDFIDETLGVLSKRIVLSTPSLCGLIPAEHYDEVRDMIPEGTVRDQVDNYHVAQATLQSRLAALEAQGVTFSFISGYGMPFGAITSDYKAFGFMKHSAITNSDEIINIDSTAPGTSYVPYNAQFADTQGRELSPDGTIDISTTWYKDSTWFFYGQKHELEYNNIALRLAIDLALGTVKTVDDCDDASEDEVYYPQFNNARFTRNVVNDYIPDFERYIANGGEVTPEQYAVYEKTVAMVNSNVADYEADNALIEEMHDMMVDLGIYQASVKKTSKIEEGLGKLLKLNNDRIVKMYGSKGFLDFNLDFSC